MAKPERNSGAQSEISDEQIQKIEKDYQVSLARSESLLEEVEYILKEKLKARNLKVHAIEKRVKELSSVIAKCKRDNIGEFSELQDIVAARVVCLFRPDMDSVGTLIRENFDVVEVDDKLSADNNPLGYLSVHYSCKIPNRYSGPRYENTDGVVFEIQVRTLCMHCWAAVSHYLDYKGDWDVPAELKRALSALSGLFYVADSEFEQFYSARAASLKRAETSVDPAANEEINLDTMAVYLRTKFPKRKQYGSDDVSSLVHEIKRAGYASIADVDRDIERAKDAFAAYEKRRPPTSGKFAAVGVARVSLRLANKNFKRGVDHLYDEFSPLVR